MTFDTLQNPETRNSEMLQQSSFFESFRTDSEDNFKEQDYSQSLYVIPLLSKRDQTLLHHDQFISQEVEFTTFTPQDDILIKLKNSFLVVDKFGILIQVLLDDEAHDVFQHFECTQIQIVEKQKGREVNERSFFQKQMQQNGTENGLSLLMEDLMNNRMVFLRIFKQVEGYRISMMNKIEPRVPISLLYNFSYAKATIDCNENIYKMLITQDQEVYFTVNGKLEYNICSVLSDSLQNLNISEDIEETNMRRETRYHRETVDSQDITTKLKQNDFLRDEPNQINLFDFDILTKEDLSQGNIVYTRSLIFKANLSIYVIQIDENREKSKKDRVIPLRKLNLDLNEGCITQLMPVTNTNQIQFVYVQKADNGRQLGHYLFNWDISKNKENMMYSWKSSSQIPYVYIWRGVTQKSHYFIPLNENTFYDLRFEFPLNFYSGYKGNKGNDIPQKSYDDPLFGTNFTSYLSFYSRCTKNFIAEIKVGQNNSALLGISHQMSLNIQHSQSFIDIQYAIFLLSRFQEVKSTMNQSLTLIKPVPSYLSVLLPNGITFLHLFATNENFLQQLLHVLESNKNAQNLVYHILYISQSDNSHNNCPISIALNKYSPKCIDLMFKILSLDKENDFLRHVTLNMSQLLQLKSDVINEFLSKKCHKQIVRMPVAIQNIEEVCIFTTTLYNGIQNIVYTKEMESQQIWVCCRKLICNRKLKCWSKWARTQDIAMQYLNSDQSDQSDSDSDIKIDNDNQIIDEVNKRRNYIYFTTYDMQILMKEKNSKHLIKYLSNLPISSSLFENKLAKVSLEAHWHYMRPSYPKIVFLYLIQFVLQISYYFIFEIFDPYKKPTPQDQQSTTNQQQSENTNSTNISNDQVNIYLSLVLIALQLPISFYLMRYEFRRMVYTRIMLIIFFWLYNLYQILLLIIDLVCIILYRYADEDGKAYILLVEKLYLQGLLGNFLLVGMIIFLIKIKSLPVLRFYIQKMFMVFNDISPLLLLYICLQVIILVSLRIEFVYYSDQWIKDYKTEETYWFEWIYKAMEYIYGDTYAQLKTLHDNITWQQDGVDRTLLSITMMGQNLVFTLFFTFLNLFLCYFLIAAIMDSFKTVSLSLKRHKYHSIAQIIYQNGILYDITNSFKDSRYIVKPENESSEDQPQYLREI